MFYVRQSGFTQSKQVYVFSKTGGHESRCFDVKTGVSPKRVCVYTKVCLAKPCVSKPVTAKQTFGMGSTPRSGRRNGSQHTQKSISRNT